jgi:precorrin-4/cobalt-precorrin-4 C11-methyltransferase
MSKVYFIGAGPGDKELITLKAIKIIEKADIIIYAGSLVNKEILNYSKNSNVEVYNSAVMNLDETNKVIHDGVKNGKLVARLHTGDPSIYGAILEQIILLEENNIEYEIIPGVSSAFSAAASINAEYTIPEISQTVIFTRVEGKTPVPEREQLRNIAKVGATLIIFLSVNMIEKVKNELLQGAYSEATPVVIAKRVSWKDEETFFTNIGNMDKLVKEKGIKKTALILVGEVFNKKYRNIANLKKSKLYDKNFATEFRNNRD